MDIRTFGPDDHDDVAAWAAVNNAVVAHDSPWEHPTSAAALALRLRHGWDGEPGRPYLGLEDGVPVALGMLSASERDNRHLAWLDVAVLPEARGHGHGRAMLERLEADAAADGRTTLGISAWDGTGCDGFGVHCGYTLAQVGVNRRQYLADVDPAAVARVLADAEAASADYELVRVLGRVADAEADAVAAMAAAINDAPRGDLDLEDEVFDADRLRAYEDAQLARGFTLYRLMVRHAPSGELAGQTVVVIDGEDPTLAEQHDTSVVAAHRGHRLGALLKAGMMGWLAETEPQVREIDTWNAESNGFMIGVNEQLGYRVMGRGLNLQKTTTG